jgi:hypothetical protein
MQAACAFVPDNFVKMYFSLTLLLKQNRYSFAENIFFRPHCGNTLSALVFIRPDVSRYTFCRSSR